MNKFAIFKLKEFFIIIILFLISSKSFSNEFEIKAEKVNFKKTENLIIAEGNALAFNNDGKKISSDKIIYFKNKDLIQTFGNSKFIDSNKTLTAENFSYSIASKIINASGNVVFIDKDKNKFFFKKFTYNEIEEKGTGKSIVAKTSDGSYLQSKSGKLDNKNKIVELDNGEFTSCTKIKNKKVNSVLHGHLKAKKLFITKRKNCYT